MDLELRGKTVLVTGASSGIGAATAEVLAEEGADVAIAYGRNKAGAEETRGKVEALGRRAWICSMDMNSTAAVLAGAALLSREIAGLDGLVLCAGESVITPLDELSPEEWSRVIDTNLNGTYRVLHSVHELLNEGSSVVIVSSVSAQTGARAMPITPRPRPAW